MDDFHTMPRNTTHAILVPGTYPDQAGEVETRFKFDVAR